MIDLPTAIEIVRSCGAEEVRNLVGFACAGVMLCVVLAPFAVVAWRRFRKTGIGFCLIAFCFLYAAAVKPPKPIVTWDEGLADDGSVVDTNNLSHVHFKWAKAAYIAAAEPLYFAAKHNDAGPDIMPSEIGETTAGALTWDYTFTSGEIATNYQYYAYMGGSQHTNAVWLGSILIKQTPGGNAVGVDKMVLIKAKLEVNGKHKAPPKKEE